MKIYDSECELIFFLNKEKLYLIQRYTTQFKKLNIKLCYLILPQLLTTSSNSLLIRTSILSFFLSAKIIPQPRLVNSVKKKIVKMELIDFQLRKTSIRFDRSLFAPHLINKQIKNEPYLQQINHICSTL